MADSDLAYVDATGFHYADYPTVLAYFQDRYRAIYGNDVYIEPDSQDGQWIATVALAVFETLQAASGTYSSFSPATALKDALSRNVKINGLRRRIPSYSTVDLLIVGQIGTQINNGIAQDTLDQKWALPALVTIPLAGQITVTATAVDIGAVSALENTVNRIYTPTLGWQTVNNPLASTDGAPVETDSELRQRQTISTENPSLSVFEGIVGAVASVPGVTRVAGYENDTDAVDVNGIPARSISLVVEGGDAQAIADVIALKKTPGTGTYGTTGVTTIDKYGLPNVIRFYRPTIVTIGIEVTVNPLPGYTSAVKALIQAADAAYISGLKIGADVYLAKLYTPSNLLGTESAETFDITQIRIKKNAGAFGTSNIAIAFNEAAFAATTDVIVLP